MDRAGRKQAASAYRERKVTAGVYALRCGPTGQVWVGRAPDIATIENRVRFQLRQGASSFPALQQAWNAHGADAFTFEVLEELDGEELGLSLQRELKNRHAAWVEKLAAQAI
ncbi:GIY-YIG nuclease family protein [Novosphingobium album (ex Liu et al. 2023)]|uniref:GIY-YIG nuclease family protein n=1 Tax=Novosphingobium album (ex Liu et al. 2023) TaxID=3031130 RepID=A0ABT5WVM6_9SPHN|nr:GIY-YIG nuclease family protein [Novosphingobium album (ex Liu et al. 2023)]MDE8653971.1 GIY-YIG nuclease family protein [Novosphingobium album (ex Liu et al. 2023)]